jgi:hypothetical protein
MSDSTRGQVARKQIRETIEANLSKYSPNTIPKMANLIAYDYNLSPDTVRYCYLPMFIDKGILILVDKNGIYNVAEPESFTESVKREKEKEKKGNKND